ncbi:MAG: hypothetical protein HQK91_09225 [Nitrospirae bacterium]|nr:hypothetical protein [Nitrospirota bacterium]
MEEIEISFIDLINYNIRKSSKISSRGNDFLGSLTSRKNKCEVKRLNLGLDHVDCETRTFHSLNIV